MHTPLLEQISETETALQAAWSSRNGEQAQRLRAHLAELWRRRREEIATNNPTGRYEALDPWAQGRPSTQRRLTTGRGGRR